MSIPDSQIASKNLKKSGQNTVLRLNKSTAESLRRLVEKANKKEYGKRIRADQIVNTALALVRPEHLIDLQQSSMSNADRIEALFKVQVEKKKSLTKDEFYGLLLAGKLSSD